MFTKNCFPAQNLTEIAQAAAEFWQNKTIFNKISAVGQLEFF